MYSVVHTSRVRQVSGSYRDRVLWFPTVIEVSAVVCSVRPTVVVV